MIENMGDASEAVEELMWLVGSEIGFRMARKLLKTRYYPMVRGETEIDDTLKRVYKMMRN